MRQLWMPAESDVAMLLLCRERSCRPGVVCVGGFCTRNQPTSTGHQQDGCACRGACLGLRVDTRAHPEAPFRALSLLITSRLGSLLNMWLMHYIITCYANLRLFLSNQTQACMVRPEIRVFCKMFWDSHGYFWNNHVKMERLFCLIT
jgi:hypothetical protein